MGKGRAFQSVYAASGIHANPQKSSLHFIFRKCRLLLFDAEPSVNLLNCLGCCLSPVALSLVSGR